MLKLELVWDEKLPKGSIEDITGGKGTLSVNNKIIWNNVQSIWVEFLEHLITSWDFIVNEGVLKENASDIDKLEFELNHDLSKGIKRQIVPSILICRYGNNFEVRVGEEKYKMVYKDVLWSLNSIGEQIIRRIKKLKSPEVKILAEKWNKINLLTTVN